MRSTLVALLGAAGLTLALAGCGGDPAPSSSPSTEPSASASSSAAASPSASPSETPDASADITLPASCEDIYSATMLAQLTADLPPLNDPGLTLDSTGYEAAYEVLQEVTAAGDTLRCTWGMPSEVGMATNVSIVTPAQAEAVLAGAEASGLNCAPLRMGTICRIVVENSEEEGGHVWGETHFLAGNGWVSTAWINYGPDGYTEDIVASVWG